MNYSWVPATIHAIPLNAVLAGFDSDGSQIYVGRTYFEGGQVPCKVIPRKRAAYISNNGIEYLVGNYLEILCGYGLQWIPARLGGIPPGAIPVGYCRTGDTLYVGRAHFLGTITPGKVIRSHRCLYVPYCGREYSIHEYEVLVNTPIVNINLKPCSIQ